jgi:NAD(P)-dependent dehydrogenase (short-subunit alcohol dehydrogenase family)
MRIELSGKKAVVTGGANGIGLACAKALASAGADVVVWDLERERPHEVAAALGATGLAADVTEAASIERAFAQTGPPDIVIANAGTAFVEPLEETSRSTWDRTIALNLTGLFLTVQQAVRLMKPRRRGAIVVTASTNSYDGEANLSAYNASKAGVLGIVHTAANEMGPYGIRINAVCPGMIRTRLTASTYTDAGALKDYFRAIPMGRGGEPEEVANAVLFLASDLASFITGAALIVDGGQMASKFATWNERMGEFRKDRWVLREGQT